MTHRTNAMIRTIHRMWAAKPSPPKMARINSSAISATIPLLLFGAPKGRTSCLDYPVSGGVTRARSQHPPVKISRLEPVQSHFRVEVRNQGRATVIAVSGELDLASSPALQEELDRLAASDSELLIIDLRELDFMDSTGLSVLVRAHQRAEEQGRRLAMVKGPQQVQRLLSLTGVGDRLTLVDAPEDLLDEE
jgi:anti-sigma B factor antagonist